MEIGLTENELCELLADLVSERYTLGALQFLEFVEACQSPEPISYLPA